jgi:NodT family efflux transporter outer membrane factor (OMF) lipoprotein
MPCLHFPQKALHHALLALAGAVLLGACAHPPASPRPQALLPVAYQAEAAQDIRRWRDGFPDPLLHQVVDRVLAQNRDLQGALARLDLARAQAAAAGAEIAPRLDGEAALEIQRRSLDDPQLGGAERIPGFTRETRSSSSLLRASWEADLFGRLRRERAGALARVEAEAAAAAGLRLSLSAEAASAYVDLRALQTRRRLLLEAREIDQALLAISRARRRGGEVSRAEVLQAQAQALRSQSQIHALDVQIGGRLQALATLLAEPPSAVATWLADGELPRLRGERFHAGLPADLLRRRPDLIESEARLRAASEDLAAAVLARYPRLSLSASLGWVAEAGAALMTADALSLGAGVGLDASLLDAGRNRARVDQQRALAAAAVADFEQTLARALAETETRLRETARLAAQVDSAAAAVVAQDEAATLLRASYAAGITPFSSVLDAQRTLNGLRADAVQAEQQRLLSFFALYAAAGGDWPASP